MCSFSCTIALRSRKGIFAVDCSCGQVGNCMKIIYEWKKKENHRNNCRR